MVIPQPSQIFHPVQLKLDGPYLFFFGCHAVIGAVNTSSAGGCDDAGAPYDCGTVVAVNTAVDGDA